MPLNLFLLRFADNRIDSSSLAWLASDLSSSLINPLLSSINFNLVFPDSSPKHLRPFGSTEHRLAFAASDPDQ
jgi:hypothetical protein